MNELTRKLFYKKKIFRRRGCPKKPELHFIFIISCDIMNSMKHYLHHADTLDRNNGNNKEEEEVVAAQIMQT